VASLTTLLVSDTGAVLEAFGERPWTYAAGAPAPLDPARPARVALSGSAGTGKTTLGRALAERLGVPFLEEGMRRRIAGGLVLHDLSRAELRALVLELWREQRTLEERAPGGFVADRSSLDYAAFWLHYGLSDGDRESEGVVLELAHAARTYGRILLLPWGVLPLVHDGVRSTDRFVQLRFQTIVEGLLRRYAGPQQVLALPAEAAELDERLAYVLGDLLPA
jgi:nicotinamide riboside kinase